MASAFSSIYHRLLCEATVGNPDDVEELLELGKLPKATKLKGPWGCTALHAAVEAGDV
jgi:hypothetical protein